MDSLSELSALQRFAEENKNEWNFVGKSGAWWGFVWIFNPECRIMLHVHPQGYTLRTHDRKLTHAGPDLYRCMREAARHFETTYGYVK